jgi:hypothetical protein
MQIKKSSFRQDAETSTLEACAPQNNSPLRQRTLQDTRD